MEKNGKYIEYYICGVKKFTKFIGEYLNNKKWNGKGFDENGTLEYEIVNGKGKIKEYDENDYLKFEGEYLNGIRNGNGKEFKNLKLIFEGEYKNGKINGKGKEYYNNNSLRFEGEYRNGKRWNAKGIYCDLINGKGVVKEHDYYKEVLFETEYLNGKRNGKGKEYQNKELRFEGEYLNGERNGKGKEYKYDKLEVEEEY